MTTVTDWFPSSRAGQLAMAKNWAGILTSRGTAWGVPEAVVTGLSDAAVQAEGVLAAAMNKTVRTQVVTAHCREIFAQLEAKMRDIKRRYFLSPPL